MPHRPSTSATPSPALVAAAAFATGIVVGSSGDAGGAGFVGLLIIVLLLAGAALRLAKARRYGEPGTAWLLTAAGLSLTACAGGLRYALYYAVPADHPVLHALDSPDDRQWTGRIADDPVYRSGRIRFVIELSGPGPPVGLLVSGRASPEHLLRRCDEISVRGRLDRLPRPRNPGDFDYGRHLFRSRIYARILLAEGGIRRTGRNRSGWICGSETTRSVIRSRLDRFVPGEETRAVLHALLLGDRRALDPDVRDRFARMGLLHLLAVSGLHVMIVGMMFYRLLGPTLKRLRLSWRASEGVRTSATTALLLGYMVLTGCTASVVRAVVMTVLFLTSTALQRPARPLNTLGFAVLVLLAVRPAHLFEAGFQLSVTAVAAILTITPQITTWVPAPASRLGRRVHSAATVTLAATIGTLPVSLHHFGQAGLAGLALNLPGIPLTAAALSAGVAMIMLGSVRPELGATLGASADVFAGALLQLSTVGDRHLRWSVVQWRIDEPALLIALTLAAASLACWHLAHLRWRCLLLALTVLVTDAWRDLALGRHLPQVNVIFLDVGQGDAAVVRLPDGDGVLIDAGPRTFFADAGARVVVPQLAYHGIRRLAAVVITHPDSDHLGGLPAVLRSVPVERVIRSGFVHDSRLYAETNALLDSLGVPELAARAGDTLAFSPYVRGYVLHPPETHKAHAANDHSVVMLVRFGNVAFLLTGDATAAVELRATRAYGDLLSSELLKVGHHGSRTSSTSALLHRVAARTRPPPVGRERIQPYAVVSVGARNRFGLPDDEVLSRLEAAGFRIVTTSRDGAAWFRTNGQRIERVSWRSP